MVTAGDVANSKTQATSSDSVSKNGLSSVAETVDKLVAVLHGVEPPQHAVSSVLLGIVPSSEVCLEGVPVKALLDTGSPISITSLDFFLKVCVQNRKPSESPVEWGRGVKQWLEEPTVSLHSYGGGELNVVSQVQCRVSRDNFVVETVLQVQRGAPVDLLLGTDTLPKLGFIFSRAERDGRVTNLLPELKGTPSDGSHVVSASAGTVMQKPPDVSTEEAQVATVRLVQATRLPAHHVKLVRASVDNPELFGSVCLFEPNLPELHRKGVTMSDGLVDAQGAVTLLMNN